MDINHNSEQCDRRWCNTSRNLAGSERAERMDATREHAARAAATRSSNEHSATRGSDKAQRQLDACGASCCCQGESWSAGTLARPASGAAGHHCKHQLRHGLAALTCACTAGGRAMTMVQMCNSGVSRVSRVSRRSPRSGCRSLQHGRTCRRRAQQPVSSRMLLLYNWHGWDVVLGVWSCVCIKGAAGGAMGGLRAD